MGSRASPSECAIQLGHGPHAHFLRCLPETSRLRAPTRLPMRVDIKTAAAIGQVQPGTIRKWVQRGHIAEYDGEYETTEILLWLEQTRNDGKAYGGLMSAHTQYQHRRD